VASYQYRAVDAASEIVEGRMDGASKSAIVDQLQALGQVPLSIEEVSSLVSPRGMVTASARFRLGFFRNRRFSTASLTLLTRQLAVFLMAGLTLDDALRILEDIFDGTQEKRCLRLLLEKISGGAGLGDAMAAQGDVFPKYYVSMVRAGEAGANVATVLDRLADYMERSKAAREHIKSALTYPLIVLVTCGLSLVILFMFVIPRFEPLFEQAGANLPFATQAVLAISEFLRGFWWAILAAITLAVFLIVRQIRNPARSVAWDRRILKLPLFGDLIIKSEIARFSRTLGTLMVNGVPLLSALAITREALTNRVVAEAVGVIADGVKIGKGLAEPLQKTRIFPPLAVHLVRAGEEGACQEDMLIRIADIFDGEVHRSTDRLLALISPIVTIGLGLIVALVIGSILTAILGVYELTG
jgi:general secretion pathway protein F